MRRQKSENSNAKISLLQIAAWVTGGLLLGVATINIILATFLTGAMYPGVSIAGRDVSYKTRLEAASSVSAVKAVHTITVELGERTYKIKSDQLGAERDLAASVNSAYSIGRNTPFPIIGIFEAAKNGRAKFSYTLNPARLNVYAQQMTNDIGRSPVNAKVELINGEFVATPDQDGLEIDSAELTRTLQAALGEARDRTVTLKTSRVKADVRLPETEPVLQQARQIVAKEVSVSYGDRVFRPDKQTIASWLTFPLNKKDNDVVLSVTVDEAKVRGYIQSIANEVDVAPVNKKVTIKNGVSQTDQEGQDGLALNQEEVFGAIKQALSSGSALAYTATARPISYKTQYNRVTTLDVGRYIEINLTTQQLWVYQDSEVIYTSPITSGATGMGFPTVTGLFSIYSKSRNIWLDGRAYGDRYNYRVLVDYWMPFYGGFGMHDAWRWRSTYGGPDYYYNGSHGCVNLPLPTAQFIYGWAEVGTPVWVHT